MAINKVKVYSIAGVNEVVSANLKNMNKPMKCWYCHHEPCRCKR